MERPWARDRKYDLPESSRKKYKSVVHAFMYEEGTSTTISQHFSGVIFKNYVLYGKEI